MLNGNQEDIDQTVRMYRMIYFIIFFFFFILFYFIFLFYFFAACLHFIPFPYISGADRFSKDIAMMTGREVSVFLRVLWVIVIPTVMVVSVFS